MNVIPKTIVETDFGDAPANYEGYLYRFTNVDTNQMYVGIHKGKFGDGYWNSATDKDMQKELAGDGKFKYEILEYGDYTTMTAREYEILKTEDAPNNPLYYNKTVGAPKFTTVNLELVLALKEKIRNEGFPIAKELIDIVVDMMRLQVRSEDMSEHQTEIAQKVDDALGNTDGYMTVVLENRNGADLRIDGNHSVYGIAKSKHGKEINVLRVPENVHKGLNDAEVQLLGNLLNAKPERPTVPLDSDDALKQLIKNFTDLGTPVTDASNKALLIAMGFSTKKSNAIIKKAKVEQDTLIAAMGGKIKIDWDASPFDTRLESILEDAKDANTMVLTVSSGMVHVSRILNEIYQTNTGREQLKQNVKKEIKIFVKHPSEAYYNNWKDKQEQADTKFLKYFAKPLGITVRFIDLPMYESDIM